MSTLASDRAGALLQLAQQACRAGQTAEYWLLELTESAVRAAQAPVGPRSPVVSPGSVAVRTPFHGSLTMAGPEMMVGHVASTQAHRRADYLRSIAQRIALGGHARGEVELYELIEALKTWTDSTAQSLVAMVLRLADVTGLRVNEFVFRVGRAVMASFNLAAPELARVLVQAARTALVLTAVVVVSVVLAILLVQALPLGAALLTIVAVIGCVSAVLTILEDLGPILAAAGFPWSGEISDWYRENSWFGAMISVLLSAGALTNEVCMTVLKVGLTAGLAAVGMAQTLLQSQVAADTIGKGLALGWLAARSCGAQAIEKVGQAFKSVLGWTAEEAGTALAQAQVSAGDCWDAITGAYTASFSQLARIFKGSGAGYIADKLWNKANASAQDVAGALKDAGFAATDVAKALKDKCGADLVGVARAMKNSGWGMGDVVTGVAVAFNMARTEVETALRAAGLM